MWTEPAAPGGGAAARTVRRPVVLDGEWNMGIPLKVPMAVMGGGLLCTRGQIDVDAEARVLNPGEPRAQVRACLGHLAHVLEAAAVAPEAVLQVNLYWRAGGAADPDALAAAIRTRLGADVPVAVIPVPWFYYPGIELEIDLIAAAEGPVARWSAPLGRGGHLRAARCARGTFFAGRLGDAGAEPIRAVAVALGAGEVPGRLWLHVHAGDAVRARRAAERITADSGGWHMRAVPCVAPGTREVSVTVSGSWHAGGLDPVGSGPALLSADGVGFLDLALAGGGPGRNGLAEAARRAMEAIEARLAARGLGFADVLKATTYYVGDDSAEDLYANLRVRDGHYADPGPASTGVPFVTLGGRARIAVSLVVADPLSLRR